MFGCSRDISSFFILCLQLTCPRRKNTVFLSLSIGLTVPKQLQLCEQCSKHKTKGKKKGKKTKALQCQSPPPLAVLLLLVSLTARWSFRMELQGTAVEISIQKMYCLSVWPPESALSGVAFGGHASKKKQPILPNSAVKQNATEPSVGGRGLHCSLQLND